MNKEMCRKRFLDNQTKQNVIPSAVSISPHGKQGKRGFLWRLSTKRLVYTPEWKRKYCVLSGGGYLYYYESETSQGGDRGSGVIDLRCVMDCVEAPLTDHKKATNVFILIAKQRGFFNQGRHYLSAETLFDMKDWVKQIKAVLTNLVEPNRTAVNTPKVASILEHHSTTVPEPLYASIKEESIHRSNSMSTLPSLCRGDQGEADYLNRSMDDCPMLGLGHTDHNHTYSYSSSDDSLNESFTINFNQKSHRFAEAPAARKPIKNKPTISVNYEYDDIIKSPNYESIKSPPLYARPVLRHSTPTKAVDTSDYIKQMYEDMERVDKQLEMVAKIETDRQSNTKMGDSEGSVNNVVSYVDDGAEVDGAEKLEKIEAVMTKLNAESEKITQMLSQIQNTTSTNVKPGEDLQAKLDNSKLLEMVGNYQKAVAEIQSQAMELLLEIQSTQAKVVRSLNDAEEAKHSFLLLKREAEHLLSRLQAQVNRQNPESKIMKPNARHQPASPYTLYSQTYPRVRPSLNTQIGTISSGKNESGGSSETFNDTIEEVRGEEAPKYTFPVYAQVRKSHSDALRKKSTNLSPEDVKIRPRQFGNLCDPRLSPAGRNRHILSNSGKDNANTSERQFRPKRLTFDENI
eukprot:TRINITY_DN9518_c0_g1_i5.p1 TRINITY_DN9518_c0_g1~~TRINITY_DN9518_c0_g1_i5.p1  ORF type:complete len:629 (-),score=132.62 TRINITY_DN9518_c0_g1_i5:17-1903(-)